MKKIMICIIMLLTVVVMANEFKNGDIICQIVKNPKTNYNKLTNCRRIVDIKKKKYLYFKVDQKFKIESDKTQFLKKYIKVN